MTDCFKNSSELSNPVFMGGILTQCHFQWEDLFGKVFAVTPVT